MRLPLSAIKRYIADFLLYACCHSDLRFRLTAIGCGLAGYQPREIAPLFAGAPENVEQPPEFLAVQGR